MLFISIGQGVNNIVGQFNDLKLDKQNPIGDLIVKSATEATKESNFELYVINQLGKRYEKLTIYNEKHSIKFKQMCCIENQEWGD
jgi:hypothetical protein